MKRDQWLLLILLAVAAALRVFWNDVAQYSPADERVYTHYTGFLLDHSYRELVQRHLADSSSWVYPNPLRWGYFLLTTLSCKLSGRCDERTLAWLSTVAGVACVWLTFRLGKALVSQQAGLVAAALTVSSPLQLALGRRALQDEVFCALVLLGLLMVVEKRRAPSIDNRQAPRHSLGAAPRLASLGSLIAALTLCFAVKETFFLVYPALVWAALRRDWSRRELALLALPPLLYFGGFVFLSHSAGDFFALLSVVANAAGAPYAARYQAGPPHRILLDLFTLAPLVMLFAVAAVGRRQPELRLTEQLAALILLVFSLSASKNVRYVVVADPLLRILAASSLLALLRGRWLVLTLMAMGTAELWLFHRIFIDAQVYDPVSDNLLRALGVIP